MFWPRAGNRTFLAPNGQLQGKELKLEKYESVEHVISFFAITKGRKFHVIGNLRQ